MIFRRPWGSDGARSQCSSGRCHWPSASSSGVSRGPQSGASACLLSCRMKALSETGWPHRQLLVFIDPLVSSVGPRSQAAETCTSHLSLHFDHLYRCFQSFGAVAAEASASSLPSCAVGRRLVCSGPGRRVALASPKPSSSGLC